MPKYSSPPLSELSIALQFGAPLPLTPNLAVRVLQEISPQYSVLSIKEPIGKLGAPPVAMLKSGDDLAPRYWFSSEDDYFLMQLQNDLVAFNWRKRSAIGDVSRTPYPGFEQMANEHHRLLQLVFSTIGVSDVPPPSAINLYYENIWLREDGKSLDEYFAFWKKLGIVTGGTVVQFSKPKFEGAIGEAARIDVAAQTGGVDIDGKSVSVCRLTLSAFDFPNTNEEIGPALRNIHERVTEMFERVTTSSAQDTWK